MNLNKIKYCMGSAWKRIRGQGGACSSCGCSDSVLVDRKALVTEHRRCKKCRLLFRTPTTTIGESEAFYDDGYEQGYVTKLPSEAELLNLQKTKFEATPNSNNYLKYISILQAFGVVPGQRVLDYGCSWGYGTRQMVEAGFEVQGFEVSKPRCAFARNKLHVDATSNLADLTGAFDCFFSGHVIEHVPSVAEMFRLAHRVVREGGLFVAITPNGSLARRNIDPTGWHNHWGLVHPQLIDEDFVRCTLREYPFLVASNPYNSDDFRGWNGRDQIVLNMEGDELLLAFRCNR